MADKPVSRKCRLCGTQSELSFPLGVSPTAAQYFDDVYEPGQIENLNVLECPRCGLVYLNSDPVPYYRSVKRNTQLSSELTALRTRLAESFKHSLRLAGHQKPSLFEVGAHTGENLDIFARAGFEVTGCEYLNGSNARSVNQAGFAIWDFSLDRPNPVLPGEVGDFDVVVSFNFLEHFANPTAGLDNIASLMRPSGVGYLEVPNFDKIVDSGNFLEFVPDHLSYFNLQSLNYALKQAGLVATRVDSIFDDYILSCQFKKYTPVDWGKFKTQRELLRDDLSQFFRNMRNSNLDCFLWGAGHQALLMIKNFGLEYSFEAIIDSSPNKAGKYCRGIPIPIEPPSFLETLSSPSSILVCAGGFNEEIIKGLCTYDQVVKIYEISHGRIKTVRS